MPTKAESRAALILAPGAEKTSRYAVRFSSRSAGQGSSWTDGKRSRLVRGAEAPATAPPLGRCSGRARELGLAIFHAPERRGVVAEDRVQLPEENRTSAQIRRLERKEKAHRLCTARQR